VTLRNQAQDSAQTSLHFSPRGNTFGERGGRAGFQLRRKGAPLSLLASRPELQRAMAMLAIVRVSVGIASRLGRMVLGLLLRVVQHLTYHHSLDKMVGGESFMQGATAASDLRRFLALCACGAVVGVCCWLLYRFGRPLVSIAGYSSRICG
jgi:hypothetical protein